MPNRTYDLVVLLDADAPTDTRTKIVNDAKALIAQAGEVKASKDWGTRQLPYLINHHEQAHYHVFQFESDPEAIAKLDRGLKLTEGVLRFRIFETEPGQALPDAPPLFKREERSYERPPREASATPEEGAEAPAKTPAEVAPAASPAESASTEAAAPAAPSNDGEDAAQAGEATATAGEDAGTAASDSEPVDAPTEDSESASA